MNHITITDASATVTVTGSGPITITGSNQIISGTLTGPITVTGTNNVISGLVLTVRVCPLCGEPGGTEVCDPCSQVFEMVRCELPPTSSS